VGEGGGIAAVACAESGSDGGASSNLEGVVD